MIWIIQEHSLVMHETLRRKSGFSCIGSTVITPVWRAMMLKHQRGEAEKSGRYQLFSAASRRTFQKLWSPELDDEILVPMKTRITFSFVLFKNSSERNDLMFRFINNLWLQSKFWLSTLKDNLNSIVKDSTLRNEIKECYISANEIELAWPRQRQFYFRHYIFSIFHFQKNELRCVCLEWRTWVDKRNTLSRQTKLWK